MDCNEFHYWLTSRDIHDGKIHYGVRNHLAGCTECRALFEKDNNLERHIAAALSPEDLPRGMEDRISLSLDHSRQHVFSRLTRRLTRFTGKYRSLALAGASLAAGVILFAVVFAYLSPPPAPAFKDLNQITLQAVADHLKGNRYMSFDALETEQALAMLTKKLGFKVMLPDLGQMGYTLVGGRLCALGDCKAAYFVVEHDGKTGSLFIMDKTYIDFPMTDGSRFTTNIKGCDTCIWKDHGQVYAMVF